MITQEQVKRAKKNADILLMTLVEVSAMFDDITSPKESYIGTQDMVQRLVNHIATGQGDIKDIQNLCRG